ncbi:hypothetical protein CI15_29925 [Paraburkholderia monticola]|uniref:DUF2169 domain-containing protein n=1 Tax=Paraburkholderia monticola TaxID=1399968 RepID=A0A149PE42_9BURK|nr:DUF2169 domain-containing protein [Paraburkholderia monticola]KXU83313.1 hypothetical protein CI15_29925 [Paraburkholderia monticola]
MVSINNRSPFAAELFSFPDLDGQEVLLFVLAATFVCDREQRMIVVSPQPPVRVADEHYGDPTCTSVRFEADVALEKQNVDVIVNGTAYSPGGRPVSSVPVELQVGDIHKLLVVYGDRMRRLGGRPSKPEPFIQMPITYERAYGGYDRHDADPARHRLYPQNPVGLGFRNVRASDPSIATEFPNIEFADGPVGPEFGIPAGFGTCGRGWSPRLQLAGTYDEKWLAQQWPLLPKDFQSLHYQAAPVDQQSRQIVGGEDVLLRNMLPQGDWHLKLPRVNVPVRLFFSDHVERPVLRVDTVILEPDDRKVMLSHRLRIPVRRDRPALKEIVIGDMSGGWLRAYPLGKQYLDFAGTGGVNPASRGWL